MRKEIMFMDWNIFMNGLLEHIAIPIIIVIGGAICVIVKHYADKITKSIVAKNEISELEKKNTVRKDLLSTLNTLVEAAVGSNMQLADTMKMSGEKLTQEQITELNRSAKQLIINSLPPSLTSDDGVLMEVIGGREKLDAIIGSLMEKHVYEYKLRPKDGRNIQKQPEQISQDKGLFQRRL